MLPGNCWLGVCWPVSTVVSEPLRGGETGAACRLCPRQRAQLRTMSARTSGESNWRAMLNLTLPFALEPIQVTKDDPLQVHSVSTRSCDHCGCDDAPRTWMLDLDETMADVARQVR